MSNKRAYKRQNVNEVSLVELQNVALSRGGRGTCVGLDVAKNEIVVCVRWSDGFFERPWSVKNPDEIRLLVDLIQELKRICDSLTVGLESTGNYSEGIRYALTEARLEVHRISGKAVSDYREIFDGVPSQHDGKDAAMIAELVAFGKGTSWSYSPLSDEDQELHHQVRRLDAFREQATQWQGRLEGLLARHWPELTGLLELSSKTLLQLLMHYGSPAFLVADAGARTQLRKWGRPGLSEAKIDLVLESARTTCGLPSSAAETDWCKEIANAAWISLREENACRKRLKNIASEHKLLKEYDDAVGPVTVCILYMAVGDPHNYDSSGAYLKALGLNLKEISSGKRNGQLSITKRGPSIARKWLYFWALRAVRRPELVHWYAEFKQVGAKRGPNSEHRAMKGVVAMMRKLCRSYWYAVKHREPFDYSKVFPGRPLPKFKIPEAVEIG
jgi:transposase